MQTVGKHWLPSLWSVSCSSFILHSFSSLSALYIAENTRAYTVANYSQIHKVVTMFTKLRLDVYDWCQSSVDGSICWLQLIKLNRLCWFSSVCGELPITSLLWVEWYDNRCSCRAFATLLQGYVAMPPSQLVSNSYYDWRGFCCGFCLL